ncbi:MAG: thioredoxin [Mucilaginibacter sp.]|nr:thioredoxin [Mucilaginibacter sp.]
MKKIILYIACLLPIVSIAQEKNTLIKGTVDSKDLTKVFTIYYSKATQRKTLDSVEIKDGKFQLVVPMDGLVVSVMMYAGHDGKSLKREDVRDSKGFLVDKYGTDIHIKQSIRMAELSNNKIENEKENYVRYMYIPEADSAKIGFYINGLSPIIFGINRNSIDTSSVEKVNQYKKAVATLKKMDGFIQQKLNYQRKYVKENPDSYFSFLAVEDIARYGKDVNEARTLFAGLSDRLHKSPDAASTDSLINKTLDDRLHPEKVAQRAALLAPPKPLAIGVKAPDFTQFDVNGEAVKLSDFKGKYVLVDFWASWCVPCRRENPNLIKAYQQFKDKNFTILGVALEEKGHKDAWLAAIKKDGLIWPQVADIQNADNEARKAYKVSSIPMNFLIDPSGKIIATNLRDKVLLDKLSEILSN